MFMYTFYDYIYSTFKEYCPKNDVKISCKFGYLYPNVHKEKICSVCLFDKIIIESLNAIVNYFVKEQQKFHFKSTWHHENISM